MIFFIVFLTTSRTIRVMRFELGVIIFRNMHFYILKPHPKGGVGFETSGCAGKQVRGKHPSPSFA
jgi:hypothetical protein